jgi:endo-1,4-beta-xylanase
VRKLTSLLALFFLMLSALMPTVKTQSAPPLQLKEVFKSDFLIGAAINRRQFLEEDMRGLSIIKTQFNSITPENQLKWQLIHPLPDKYDFEGADRYVAFGEKYGMVIIGHTLVWHRQTPNWVFEDGKGNLTDRETLLSRLREHIHTVVGRYKGKIKGWDVVNEALNEDGTMRQSNWMKIIGEDYLVKAFQFAHEADPQAELYYNDYALENEPKRNGAVRLIKQLKSQGVPVAAIGLQGHNNLTWPTKEQQDETIKAFAKLGIKVNITELDINVLPTVSEEQGPNLRLTDELQAKLNPYASELPASVSAEQARRYSDLFAVYLKHRDVIDRVTFWGVTDADTWLNNWPVRGRTNYPLLFDRAGKPKPAFDAVIKVGIHQNNPPHGSVGIVQILSTMRSYIKLRARSAPEVKRRSEVERI